MNVHHDVFVVVVHGIVLVVPVLQVTRDPEDVRGDSNVKRNPEVKGSPYEDCKQSKMNEDFYRLLF